RGEYARDDDGDGFHEVHVNTMEGFWSLLRSWLRPHRGISQDNLPLYLGFNWLRVFQSVNAGHLPDSGGQERETLAVPSEQCMARSGSEYDEMRRIPTRFAYVLRRVLAT